MFLLKFLPIDDFVFSLDVDHLKGDSGEEKCKNILIRQKKSKKLRAPKSCKTAKFPHADRQDSQDTETQNWRKV